ncbi:MAG: AAA family ATPase [Nocardiaceae bacterium]|nr:AAA family ATPase [Nocardiaceae bacterium]
MKIYRGSAAGARAYLDAERGRADDYYLGEGNGRAERLTATADGSVEGLGFLEGETYEAWVAGYDPETGVSRGRIRSDANAVRFAEFVVNGPKSWSLVAELHPDIAAVYEKAQDAAAREIVSWFAQHGTTRVGPRGGQISVGVQRLEAAVIRHYTSRAGDPHRHLHLQINARVEAAGAWRGLDTVAVRNSISAVQGIGHGAIAADPGFRAALARHGYSLDPVTGEVEQLAAHVGAFSKRAEQIGRQIDGYERDWRTEHPGQEPGPGLRRSWDARAWAEARPDKQKDQVLPGPERARAQWTDALAELGFAPPEAAVPLTSIRVGDIDRDQLAARAVARLTATRSAWNVFDLRGQAELLITESGIIADTATRTELAEDLTARAAALCVPLLDEQQAVGLPEHVRAWTSPAAVETEKDLEGRFAVRGATTSQALDLQKVADTADTLGMRLDRGQAGAVAELTGTSPLVVVTGAAGAGKTTMLATTQHLVAAQQHSMIVVTPTLKAARTARRETGAETGSAAWLAYEHGCRWNSDGQWSRLESGDTDPITGQIYWGPSKNAQLRAGDLLVVDEAGMLDQDTARALIRIADQHGARVALVGDPHQLPAVGRGGVLDLAARWTSSTATLDVVHRFTRTSEITPGINGTVTDTDYARLSLLMRTGEDPGAVFDELHARGQVALYPDEHACTVAVAELAAGAWAAGERYALSAHTREVAAQLSAVVRHQLVSAGHVDDTRVAVTSAGERVGTGDRVSTRRNNSEVGVANRDLWRVQTVTDTGHLVLTPDAAGGSANPTTVTVDADYVRTHVELAYASTVYGVQGDTVTAGHLVLGDTTTAQAAYVGMTRGRQTNTVHITATDITEARRQWIDTAGRDRADLGLRTSRDQAQQAASQYASPEKVAEQRTELAARLGKAWDLREYWQTKVRDYAYEVKQARINGQWHRDQDEQLTQLHTTAEHTRIKADQLKKVADQARSDIEQHTNQALASMMQAWRQDQPALQEALAVRYRPIPAGTVARMTGQVARHRIRREEAQAVITAWQRKWGDLPMRTHNPEHYLRPHAEHAARQHLPEAVSAIDTAREAEHAAREASKALKDREHAYEISRLLAAQNGHRRYIPGDLHRYQQHLDQAKDKLTRVEQHLEKLASQPLATKAWITEQHHDWTAERERQMNEHARIQAQHAAHDHSYETGYRDPGPSRDHGYGIGD